MISKGTDRHSQPPLKAIPIVIRDFFFIGFPHLHPFSKDKFRSVQFYVPLTFLFSLKIAGCALSDYIFDKGMESKLRDYLKRGFRP